MRFFNIIRAIQPKPKQRVSEESSASDTVIKYLAAIIPIVTLLWAISQYFHTEATTDTRKYMNQYYDERYKAFRDLAAAVTDIRSFLLYSDFASLKEKKKDSVQARLVKNLAYFNYARLVLDSSEKEDSILRQRLVSYEVTIFQITLDVESKELVRKANNLGYEIIDRCGKTIKYEKTQARYFSWWPFGD